MAPNSIKEQIMEDIAGFEYSPREYVNYAYDWGGEQLPECTGPKKWQDEILQDIENHYAVPENRYVPLLISVASGHSIGKSALISWVADWATSTSTDCRGIVTANTDGQLRTKTWPEITKWRNLSINKDWFDTTATAVISADKEHIKHWRFDATPWSKQNTEAFAGLHNKYKRIFIIFDEASAIDDKIWEVTDGILTDGDTEIIWIAFGNPTRREGRFFDCFHKNKHRWIHYQIDSRTVEGINHEFINKLVEDYGEDSDIVKVRVRGIFPSASIDQLISRELIDKCFNYTATDYEWAAKVFGVDLARSGKNHNTVAIRQARKVFPLEKWQGMDGMFTASKIAELYQREKPDAIFIDDGGLGGPIVDRLKQLVPKEKVFPVCFGSPARQSKRYFNKRAEMWCTLEQAMKEGIDLPDDSDLGVDLESVPYFFDGKSRIQLPKKEDLDHSPDDGDGLSLTYAEPVIKDAPKEVQRRPRPKRGSWRG